MRKQFGQIVTRRPIGTNHAAIASGSSAATLGAHAGSRPLLFRRVGDPSDVNTGGSVCVPKKF